MTLVLTVQQHTKLFEEFLSKNGLSAHFLVKIRNNHRDIPAFVQWVYNARMSFKNIFFIAFWWDPKDPIPWMIHSNNWKKFLEERTQRGYYQPVQ